MKESEIQKQIIDYLELTGCLVVKINNTGIVKPNGSYIPPRERGISDLLVCKNGRFIAIEVKRPGGKVSPYQEAFLKSVASNGGHSFIAYSLDDVMAQFLKLSY